MKRSEMVSAIDDLVAGGNTGEDIVQYIEEAGMIPPPPTSSPFPLPAVISIQWEPEDTDEGT